VVLGTSTCSHCWTLPDTAAVVCAAPPAAGAISEAAATPKLVADTTRKPPAAMLIAGRTCAKRMKWPAPAVRCSCETSIQYGLVASGVYRQVRTLRLGEHRHSTVTIGRPHPVPSLPARVSD
jgi:hypothetical protein